MFKKNEAAFFMRNNNFHRDFESHLQTSLHQKKAKKKKTKLRI